MAKKDPWSKEEFGKTLEQRVRQFESLTSVVRAMDGAAQAAVAKELMKGTSDSTPNYNLINQNHKDYDPSKAQAVKDIIEKHYDVKNELSPFRKALDPAKLDSTSRKLVENIYSAHKDALIRNIGQAKYGIKMDQIQQQNQDQVRQEVARASSAGYNPDLHGDHVADHFIKTYGAKPGSIDKEHLKRQMPQLIEAHVAGQAREDTLYSLAPKYKKLKEAA